MGSQRARGGGAAAAPSHVREGRGGAAAATTLRRQEQAPKAGWRVGERSPGCGRSWCTAAATAWRRAAWFDEGDGQSVQAAAAAWAGAAAPERGRPASAAAEPRRCQGLCAPAAPQCRGPFCRDELLLQGAARRAAAAWHAVAERQIPPERAVGAAGSVAPRRWPAATARRPAAATARGSAAATARRRPAWPTDEQH